MDSSESLAKQSLFQASTDVEYCPKCDFPISGCRCKEMAEEAIKSAQAAKLREIKAYGGDRAQADYTLDKFDNRAAITECGCFPKRGLFIYGPVGCGKTHLAVAIIRRFTGSRLVRVTDYLRDLRACRRAEDEIALIKSLSLGPLVLDDIGVEKMSEFALTAIWELLDRRWQNSVCSLIITSNLGLDALASKTGEDRIISRIAGMCKPIKLDGEDRRLQNGRV